MTQDSETTRVIRSWEYRTHRLHYKNVNELKKKSIQFKRHSYGRSKGRRGYKLKKFFDGPREESRDSI